MTISNPDGRPEPGQIVQVRQRTYLAERSDIPQHRDEATLVHLACVDDDAQGQPLEVLWEHEVDREIVTGEAWEKIAERGFDDPKLFAAYLHTLRWNCVTSTNPRLFQSPFRAGIRLDAYLLKPLRKALVLPRVNRFIADDVLRGPRFVIEHAGDPEYSLVIRSSDGRKLFLDNMQSGCPARRVVGATNEWP